MKVAYMTNAWGAVVAHCGAANNANGAYYLSTGADADAIAGIASAGYEQIEIFDGNLLAYEGREDVFQKLLSGNKVSLLAVYSAANFIYDDILPEELFRIKKAAAFAKKFGATQIALGGGATRFDGIKEGDYKKLAAALDKVCVIAEELGMTASYHPHMGSLVQSPEQLDKVMPHTGIPLCPDTGHVVLGGGDPVAVVRKYADRIKYIHLKDVTGDGMFCPLGKGGIDFPSILDILRKKPTDVLYAIECDGWNGDPAEGARITREYLKSKLNFS
ncbi:sugar phosphate isomerase/epimerase [Treponema primitia]|uniref:sugar phosphate isomerase/epimerase family protein n=1 Tax=Treponema primitia TaxID=88058 RepID=UPI003980DE80